jgi:hypothetical protein
VCLSVSLLFFKFLGYEILKETFSKQVFHRVQIVQNFPALGHRSWKTIGLKGHKIISYPGRPHAPGWPEMCNNVGPQHAAGDHVYNSVYTVKMTILLVFVQLVIFLSTSHEPAHNNVCGPLPSKNFDANVLQPNKTNDISNHSHNSIFWCRFV